MLNTKHVGLLFLSLLLALPSVSGARTLSFQTPYSEGHILNDELFLPWFKELKQKSRGSLDIVFHDSGELVSAQHALPAMMRGRIDMTGVNAQYQESLFPHTLAFTAPYLTRDSVQSSALCQKALALPEVKAEWDKVCKSFFAWGSDRSALFSTVGPVLEPSDLVGKRVLIWAPSQMDQIRSWGGIPVQIMPPDTKMALERRLGDIFFGPLPSGTSYGLIDVERVKDVTVLPATTVFLSLAMNREVWESLPGKDRALLEKTSADKSAKAGRLLYERSNADMEIMAQRGVKVHKLSGEQADVFQLANRRLLANWWISKMGKMGVKNPTAFLKQAAVMAGDPPTATGEKYSLLPLD